MSSDPGTNEIHTNSSREISTVAEDMAAKLGEISVDNLVLEDMQHHNALNKANLEAIKNLVNYLPHIDRNRRWGEEWFATQSAHEAKKFQANVVWWRGLFPMYILGQRPTNSDEWIDLLISGAVAGPNSATIGQVNVADPIIIRARADYYQDKKAEAAVNLSHRSFSDEELTDMFDPKTGKIIVTSNSPGSIRMDDKHTQRTRKAKLNGHPTFQSLAHGIPKQIWEDFDVEKQLANLAAVFNVETELGELLAARSALPKTSPIDRLVQQSGSSPSE